MNTPLPFSSVANCSIVDAMRIVSPSVSSAARPYRVRAIGAGYEFTCPTRYDKLFSGIVVPTAALSAHGLSVADVSFRAEDAGADFGEVLRRAMGRSNRTKWRPQQVPPTVAHSGLRGRSRHDGGRADV